MNEKLHSFDASPKPDSDLELGAHVYSLAAKVAWGQASKEQLGMAVRALLDELAPQVPSKKYTRINVLDHGYVRLVDYMGSDLSIARAARVSYDADWRAGEDEGSDKRLINYLWRNHHTTPFEAVTFTFEIKAPIFVFRQWHRHRTWSYNEQSARYTELCDEFYVPQPEHIGAQDPKNKQGRTIDPGEAGKAVAAQLLFQARKVEAERVKNNMEAAFALYKQLLAENWPRELARLHLPLATYSRMFATVSLLNLFRFLTLRTDEHAQYEIRVYANALIELARIVAPVAVAAWENVGQK